MPEVHSDAESFIEAYGRNAAGEAFTRALNCALISDQAGEKRWLAVAQMVMETQERGRDGDSVIVSYEPP
jgi:hypothetical protein